MSFTETVGQPQTGNLVLQHKDYKKNKWDLDYRAHKRVVRVVEREDTSGAWKLDPDATGDLCLGYCWPNDKQQRQLPMWSFAFPVVLTDQGGDGGTPTPGGMFGGDFGVPSLIPTGQPTPTPGGGSGRNKTPSHMLPIADQQDNPDTRMKPIPAPRRVLKANGPSQGKGGDGGAGPNGQPVDPNQIDSGSATLYLGIGAGAVNQGFGGPGVGFGGSPGATFTGVRQNFSSGSSQAGANFGSVRNNFSNGGPQAGATFVNPTAAPMQGR